MGLKLRCNKVEFEPSGKVIKAAFSTDSFSRAWVSVSRAIETAYDPIYVAGREYEIEISVAPVDAVF